MVIDYIDIARELISLQQHLQADLPYHINLVDAIGADENANSRILAGILSYHDAAGNYDVLKDFTNHFFPNTNLAEMIGQPTIVTEQLVRNDKRIDIYIHEPDQYAIILENKVMDAPEQPHQLANYIEGLNDLGFTNEQIYIGYLPRTNETCPSDNSWANRKGQNYCDEFQARFHNISFRDKLLPWLKQLEIPSPDTAMLEQSIAIYTDYLEGQFGYRPNEHYIEMKTDEYFAEKLAFTDNPTDNLQKAMEAVAEIDKLKKEIVRRKREDAKRILTEWLQRAKQELPEQVWEDRTDDTQFPSIGFPMSYGGHQRAFKIFIQIDHNNNYIYYGAYLGLGCTMPVKEARDVLRPVMSDVDKFTYNLGIKMFTAHTTASEGYGKFITLAKTIIKTFQ